MATITIRRLDDSIKTRLRMRAAAHGRSMEEEAREILRAGLNAPPVRRRNLFESIRRHIEPIGGVDLTLQPRGPVRRPPKFGK
jgi:plasmid stability protein